MPGTWGIRYAYELANPDIRWNLQRALELFPGLNAPEVLSDEMIQILIDVSSRFMLMTSDINNHFIKLDENVFGESMNRNDFAEFLKNYEK